MSNKKGITMIALVITIVVLLILSGIRMAVEVNDNGVISKAEQVRIDAEQQEIIEKCERLKVFDNSNLIDVEETVKNIQENFENVVVTEPEKGKTEYTILVTKEYAKHSFTIDKNGIVELNQIPLSLGDVFAILTTDGTLYFTKSDDYEIKDDGEGNQKLYSKLKGEEITKYKIKNIEKAFIVDENKKYDYSSKPIWLECNAKVKSVEFDKIIRPKSTYMWFAGMNNCKTINLTNLDTQNVEDMSSMFNGCSSLKKIKGLSKLNTTKVTKMNQMFFSCVGLEKIDLSNWDTSNVTNMGDIFFRCDGLKMLDLSNWNTSNVTNMSYMFAYCGALEKINGLDGFNTEKVTDMSLMFKDCKLKDFKDIKKWNVGNVKSMRGLFDNCELITNLDLSNWDTLKVTNMNYMFRGCGSLIDIKLSENFKTDNVTIMDQMFNGCNSLTKIDLSNFKTENVTDMSDMFYECESLIDIKLSENFKTENVTDMSYMFNRCKSLGKLDLSNWNTSKVIDMSSMFSECESLSELKISEKFITSNVKGMSHMFYNCRVLEVSEEVKKIIEKFNTAKVGEFLYSLNTVNGKVDVYGDMVYMFGNCKKLTLDCSGWNVDKVENRHVDFNTGAPGVILPLAWQTTES